MTEHPTDALKPCPFCGFAGSDYVGLAHVQTYGQNDHRIRCGQCRATTGPHPTDEAAIVAWNTRMNAARTTPIDDEGLEWLTIECERVLYVDEGREKILCDRLPSPVTLIVKPIASPKASLPTPVIEEGLEHARSQLIECLANAFLEESIGDPQIHILESEAERLATVAVDALSEITRNRTLCDECGKPHDRRQRCGLPNVS